MATKRTYSLYDMQRALNRYYELCDLQKQAIIAVQNNDVNTAFCIKKKVKAIQAELNGN